MYIVFVRSCLLYLLLVRGSEENWRIFAVLLGWEKSEREGKIACGKYS